VKSVAVHCQAALNLLHFYHLLYCLLQFGAVFFGCLIVFAHNVLSYMLRKCRCAAILTLLLLIIIIITHLRLVLEFTLGIDVVKVERIFIIEFYGVTHT